MPRGANYNNIREKGFNDKSRTTEELREIQRRGGLASGKARQAKASMRKIVKMVFGMQVPKAICDKLKLLGFHDDDVSYQLAVIVGVLQRALAGNVNAARYLTELSGDDPTIALKAMEIKLKQDELAFRQQENTDSGGGELLVSLLQKAWNIEEKQKKTKKAGKKPAKKVAKSDKND